jgi:hypothetical protein
LFLTRRRWLQPAPCSTIGETCPFLGGKGVYSQNGVDMGEALLLVAAVTWAFNLRPTLQGFESAAKTSIVQCHRLLDRLLVQYLERRAMWVQVQTPRPSALSPGRGRRYAGGWQALAEILAPAPHRLMGGDNTTLGPTEPLPSSSPRLPERRIRDRRTSRAGPTQPWWRKASSRR